jgi:mono/diheme cytochrome c family protein
MVTANHPIPRFGVAIASLAVVASALHAAAADRLSYNRDIRPILSDNCFGCHGPDARDRKGGLRLDAGEQQDALRHAEGDAAQVDCGWRHL